MGALVQAAVNLTVNGALSMAGPVSLGGTLIASNTLALSGPLTLDLSNLDVPSRWGARLAAQGHSLSDLESDVPAYQEPAEGDPDADAILNAVFDLSPDGFVVFDRDGQCAYSNRAFESMMGWEGSLAHQGLTLAEFDERMRELRDPAQAYPALSMVHADDESFETMDLLHLVQPRPRVLTRLVRALQRGHQSRRRLGALHEAGVDDQAHLRRAALQGGQHIPQGGGAQRGHQTNGTRHGRQCPFARGIEQTLAVQLGLEFEELLE